MKKTFSSTSLKKTSSPKRIKPCSVDFFTLSISEEERGKMVNIK
jgi:hypothetical protein